MNLKIGQIVETASLLVSSTGYLRDAGIVVPGTRVKIDGREYNGILRAEVLPFDPDNGRIFIRAWPSQLKGGQ